MKYIQTWNIEKMEWLDQVRSWSQLGMVQVHISSYKSFKRIVVASPPCNFEMTNKCKRIVTAEVQLHPQKNSNLSLEPPSQQHVVQNRQFKEVRFATALTISNPSLSPSPTKTPKNTPESQHFLEFFSCQGLFVHSCSSQIPSHFSSFKTKLAHVHPIYSGPKQHHRPSWNRQRTKDPVAWQRRNQPQARETLPLMRLRTSTRELFWEIGVLKKQRLTRSLPNKFGLENEILDRLTSCITSTRVFSCFIPLTNG